MIVHRGIVIAAFIAVLFLPSVLVANEDSTAVRILVTFSDPGMTNAAVAGPSRPGYRRRSSDYLVSLPVKRAARRIARDFDLRTVDEWPIVPLKVYCQVYAVGAGVSVDKLLGELMERPEVESAQRLNRFEVSGEPTDGGLDPYARLQHNLQTLELDRAHAWSVGDGARIAIIDTGADLSHPDLVTQIGAFHDFVEHAGRFEKDAHGTAVAGVIGASSGNGFGMVGVAPSARIEVLRACWYDGDGSAAVCDSFTLAKALSHALESDPDVVNLSFGGPADPLLGRLVDAALGEGIAVVAALPAAIEPGFPSNVPGVIVVGADTESDRASLNAPGTDILVPVPGGGFDYASGTSLSAAQVSGVIALLMSRQPDMSPADVMQILMRSQANESVNACLALSQLLHLSGCRTQDEGATARLP